MPLTTRTLSLPDLAATHSFGRRLAAHLTPGDVVLLEGDLGSGKSELARAVIRARAGSDIPVPSPTFTLVQTYALPDIEITHADLYRLSGIDEAVELGLEEAWQHGALLVEWPDRAAALWPAERLTLRLDHPAGQPDDSRTLHLCGTGRWSCLVEVLAV